MAALKTAKYVREAPARKPNHKEVTTMVPTITSDESFGNLGFHMYWQTIKVPFTMASEPHRHDFPQYLTFSSFDVDDLVNLGGVIEITLSEDGKMMEKHTITKATTIYVPAGLYHNPLVFKKVTKPILMMDLYFSSKYERK
ncbi:MAG: hypothetical protein ABR958_03600 [Dehalococcoidales bacterium]